MNVQTQKTVDTQTQTQTQTLVAERTDTVIGSAVREHLIAAREAAQTVLSELRKITKAKGASQAAMVTALYQLHLDGSDYVKAMVLGENPTTEAENRRAIAIKKACADLGFTEFRTEDAKERSFVDAEAKKAPQLMRTVAPMVLRMIQEAVTPELTKGGLLKVPGRFLLTAKEAADESNADLLNKPLTLDFKTSEGATQYKFHKSFDRALASAGEALGVATNSRKSPPPTPAAPVQVTEYTSIDSIRFATVYIRKLAGSKEHVSKEVTAEIHTLVSAVLFYLGATDESGEHVAPAVVNAVLKAAKAGN